jgi:hypothetical protein
VKKLAIFLTIASMASMAGAQSSTGTKPPPRKTAVSQTMRQAGSRVISGIVLNASTGQPVTEAGISLVDSNGGAYSTDTTTDSEGRFLFAGLYDGKFSLHAEHRGYVASGFDEHEGFFTGIVTGEGIVSTGLKFMLAPQAVIFGTVTDEAGDPVAQGQIQLFRQDDRSGREEIVHVNSSNTDDLGNYEFSRLAAGIYFLAATGTPWYASHAQPAPDSAGQPSTQSALDVAFPTTYYAEARTSEDATPIPVKASDRIGINLTLQAQPAMHITVRVPSPAPNEGFTVPQLRTKMFGTMEPTQQQMPAFFSPPEGGSGTTTMELGGVPPGEYEVEMPKSNGGPEGVTHVDASSGSVTVDTSSLETQADVDGKVAMDDGSALPSYVAVSLVPDEGETRTTGANHEGAFNFHAVPAGTYRVQAMGSKGEMAVKQLAATGAAVDRSLVKIGNTAVTLAAVIAESDTAVRGFAKLDGKPAPGAMIVLVPVDGDRSAFRRDQSDSDGSFVLKQVVPGQYTVVAIEDGWELEWARSEVMARYAPHGLKVTVALHSRNIDLREPLQLQAK